MKQLLATRILAAAVFVTALGCTKDKSDKSGESITDPAAPAATAQPATSKADNAALSDDARSAIAAVLAAYEQVRADLAADRIGNVAAAATAIETAARTASGKVSGNLRAEIDRLAVAAGSLKDASATQPDEVRRLFGDVSRPLVTLLASEPSLREGRYVFKCPMAQGYYKWVQTTAEIANPYMGTRMLDCGSASVWQP